MKELKFDYDKKNDVMYISVDKKRKGIAEEIKKNVFVRFEPRKKDIVGITLIDFSKFLQKKTELSVKV